MKISIIEPNTNEEDEIIIKCHHLDDAILQLIYNLKAQTNPLAGVYEGKIHMINPSDVFYFETVDNKTFIYCQETVFECKLKLYELEALFTHTNFFRASKSTILNLLKIKNLAPAFNGRFEALLKNGEKVIISRQYVPDLKKKLNL